MNDKAMKKPEPTKPTAGKCQDCKGEKVNHLFERGKWRAIKCRKCKGTGTEPNK